MLNYTDEKLIEKYFNKAAKVDIKQRNLPHWQQKNSIYFVTFHLADSIPKEQLKVIALKRECWKKLHKKPYSISELKEYRKLFSDKIEKLLNENRGSCCLSNPINSKIVADALMFFNNKRYLLDEWVVMPNHVHVLVAPEKGYSLTKIVHSWKSYSATEINRRRNNTGQFWFHESYDHIVRSLKSLYYIREYIKDNPKKANIEITHSSFINLY